jgi:hypothetical protein
LLPFVWCCEPWGIPLAVTPLFLIIDLSSRSMSASPITIVFVDLDEESSPMVRNMTEQNHDRHVRAK